MATVSNFFAAVAAFFGWKRERQQLDNAAPMQARAAGAVDQQIKDKAAAAIAGQDLNQIRKDLAE
jgi:hypothetical protein